jgi:hypothetical protein
MVATKVVAHLGNSQETSVTTMISGLYYKPITIVNDNSSIVNKLKLHLLMMLESSSTIAHFYSTGHRFEMFLKGLT